MEREISCPEDLERIVANLDPDLFKFLETKSQDLKEICMSLAERMEKNHRRQNESCSDIRRRSAQYIKGFLESKIYGATTEEIEETLSAHIKKCTSCKSRYLKYVNKNADMAILFVETFGSILSEDGYEISASFGLNYFRNLFDTLHLLSILD